MKIIQSIIIISAAWVLLFAFSPHLLAMENEEIARFYDELMAFKATPSFQQYGFDTPDSPYRLWQDRVHALKDNPELDVRAAAGYLKILAIEYRNTGGEENDSIRYCHQKLCEHIDLKDCHGKALP